VEICYFSVRKRYLLSDWKKIKSVLLASIVLEELLFSLCTFSLLLPPECRLLSRTNISAKKRRAETRGREMEFGFIKCSLFHRSTNILVFRRFAIQVISNHTVLQIINSTSFLSSDQLCGSFDDFLLFFF
jgi:hypothetical protein